MKFLDRCLDRLAPVLLPRVPVAKQLLIAAGDAIREANQIRWEAQQAQEMLADERSGLASRIKDLIELRRAELLCVSPDSYSTLKEAAPAQSLVQLRERLWELELALEDRGWVREVTLSNLEFSRLGVQQLIRITRIYAIKNPLIKRGAEICALYVFGRGIEIRSEDDTENDVIQAFLDANQAELGHTGLAQKEKSTQTDGSLYFGLKTAPDGTVQVQTIDPLEIMEVVTDPDDTCKPMLFYRQWNRTEFDIKTGQQSNAPTKAWYPALEYLDVVKQKPSAINGVPVNWDMPILRAPGNGSPPSWRWPVPPLYAAIDWARAYREFLEDWATVQRALSRFALMIETKGGQPAIAAYNALLNTTFADADGTQIESNPPPVTGAAHIAGPDNKITAFKSAGAQSSPEQSRRMLLMVASAEGMPETFFGDASTGSLATAVSLDRPTELKFTEIQRRWTFVLTTMLRYVLAVAKGTAGSKMREAAKEGKTPQIIVKFPNVVEHSVKDMVQAIVEVGTLGGRNGIPAGIVDRRMIADLLLAEIGVENRDELLDAMGYGAGYDAEADIIDQRTQPAAQNVNQPEPGDPSAAPAKPGTPPKSKPPSPKAAKPPNSKAKEALLAARKDLRDALELIGSSNGKA